jgi:hypothetical protein
MQELLAAGIAHEEDLFIFTGPVQTRVSGAADNSSWSSTRERQKHCV